MESHQQLFDAIKVAFVGAKYMPMTLSERIALAIVGVVLVVSAVIMHDLTWVGRMGLGLFGAVFLWLVTLKDN